jgi:hypothetical protein
MKKISLAFVLLLAVISSSYGQIANFRHYQETINSAELSLIAGNQLQALNPDYAVEITSADPNSFIFTKRLSM